MSHRALCRMILVSSLAAPAAGQTESDPGQGTGPLPTNVAPVPTPICTDRPTKANVACTVPAGSVQIESDLINWTQMIGGGGRTDTIVYTDPTLKYGIGTHTDIEVSLAPYETVRTSMDGASATQGSAGDLYVRVKQRLTADAAKTQIALIPYVKVPTARQGVGNGSWEGGVIAAANIPLPAKFTLTLGPEVDVLADDTGGGHHASLVSLINLSHSVGKALQLYAEFWNEQDLAPNGTKHEYSADIAAAYAVSKTFQVDAGANFGLNRSTPDTQLYLGVSVRF